MSAQSCLASILRHFCTHSLGNSSGMMLIAVIAFSIASGCGNKSAQQLEQKIIEKGAGTIAKQVEKGLPQIQNSLQNKASGAEDALKLLESEFDKAMNRYGKWNGDHSKWTTRAMHRSLNAKPESTKVFLCVFQPKFEADIQNSIVFGPQNGFEFYVKFKVKCTSSAFSSTFEPTAEDWAETDKGGARMWEQGYSFFGAHLTSWLSDEGCIARHNGKPMASYGSSRLTESSDYADVFDSSLFRDFEHPDTPHDSAVTRRAIRKCLVADDKVAIELQVSTKPLDAIGPAVAKRQRMIGLTGCPQDFVEAFQKHVDAWEHASKDEIERTYMDVKKTARKYGAGTLFFDSWRELAAP